VGDETFVSVSPFPAAGVVISGRVAEDDTTSPPSPSVGEGAGRSVAVGSTTEDEMGLTTELDEISLERGGTAEVETGTTPPSVTVIWRDVSVHS